MPDLRSVRSIFRSGRSALGIPLPSRKPFLDTSAPTRGEPTAEAVPDRRRTASEGSVDHPCGRSSHGAVDAFQPTAAPPRTPRPTPPPPRKGGGAWRGGGALGQPPPPCDPLDPTHRVGAEEEGGSAWGSCGRSSRHALGRAAGASCVQRLDDSRNSAIHTTYRISLRSSSLQEPRYPLLRVVVAMYFDPPGGRHLSPA